MSLINCPECGNNVSDIANVCPHCGYPIANATKSNGETNTNKNISFNWLKKILTSSKCWLAIYLCYVLVLLIACYSDGGFFIFKRDGYYMPHEYQSGPLTTSYYYTFHHDDYHYPVLDVRNVFDFVIGAVLPLFVYWIIRLFVKSIKENK